MAGEAQFRIGEQLRAIDGPFFGLYGTVSAVSEPQGTLEVLVSFFGRRTIAKLRNAKVERAHLMQALA